MRYQWVARTLANPHINPDEIMSAFAAPLLRSIQDKGQISDTHTRVLLLADRFYATADLIAYCNQARWDYRIRMKGNTRIQILNENIPARQLGLREDKYVDNAYLASTGVAVHLGFIHEEGHPEAWIIGMGTKANQYKVLDYGMHWGLEAMFSVKAVDLV